MIKVNALSVCIAALCAIVISNSSAQKEFPRLENPMTKEYILKNVRAEQPRLVLTPEIREDLQQKIKTDPVLQNLYAAILCHVDEIYEKELLIRKVEGRRLLSVSREMLWRVNMLGFAYSMEGDVKVLNRINDELLAVCDFKNWNPSHYLDVAEMSMAVALALDWTMGDLPEATRAKAIDSLIHKGILTKRPNGKKKGPFYIKTNWNQVCNGGMIAAAIAIVEEDPELAAQTIHRALDGMPNALKQYMPDGVYPEGPTYWGYGTGFSVMTSAMFESAFGHDFGLYDYPGFAKSAEFQALGLAPSGLFYNFGDCEASPGKNGDVILAWFAAKTGNARYFQEDRFLMPPSKMDRLHRLGGAAMAWIAQYAEKSDAPLPTAYAGRGPTPVAIFMDENYYLGAKGGVAWISHGNMDAGSFIFELDGVRWSVDLERQEYHDLEKTGFDLWNSGQAGERWTLLSQNNRGHSTLTVNGEDFRVNGHSKLLHFEPAPCPKASFDLTLVFGGSVDRSVRTFLRDTSRSLVISDHIKPNEKTRMVTWQMMTLAEVELVSAGATLKQEGRELKLELRSHPEAEMTVVSLDPPPLELDRRVEGLKRIEIKIPVEPSDGAEVQFSVRLVGAK